MAEHKGVAVALILLGLVSLLLQLTGIFTTTWLRIDDNGVKENHGLWEVTECRDNKYTDCRAGKSMHSVCFIYM